MDNVTEKFIQLTISKAFRYDGAKNYSGGDLNFFNGTIKADGNFNFESGGTQAKFETIAVDSDGTISIFNPKKFTPPFVYVENSDFVSKILEKNNFDVAANFEDFIETDDSNGNLTIRKRAKFDGDLFYSGNFEYAANASRRFDGGLNYNGVYKVEACGIAHFDGAERYGGRKNHTFIEYTTDINGNTQIINFDIPEKIPVATRGKLGFVIIGKNINVTDEGEITLPESLKAEPLFEMPVGTLKTLFENWRG